MLKKYTCVGQEAVILSFTGNFVIKRPLANESLTTQHMITNQNQRKNSYPASTGKEKWMKLTGPMTFSYINKYSKTEILAFCY